MNPCLVPFPIAVLFYGIFLICGFPTGGYKLPDAKKFCITIGLCIFGIASLVSVTILFFQVVGIK